MIDVLYQWPPDFGVAHLEDAWRLGTQILNFLESAWEKPDEGIWEVQGADTSPTGKSWPGWLSTGPSRRSRSTDVQERWSRWKEIRDTIHAQICREGFESTELNAFVQSYGSKELDASLLMIPLVGFLASRTIRRVLGTVATIEPVT